MEHIFTDENFEAEVLKSPVPVLVDFWAVWCGPCKMMSPIVEEIANEVDASQAKVGKLNVDEAPNTAMQFNVLSIPTFLIFKGGQVVDQSMGTTTKENLKEKLMKHIG